MVEYRQNISYKKKERNGKEMNAFLDEFYRRSGHDDARATLLLFWTLVAMACIAYFPLGWLAVRLDWVLYSSYNAFKLGVGVFGVLSILTTLMVANVPYKVFHEFVLVQYIFGFCWALFGELFSGKYQMEWYWYVPFLLFVVSGTVGIFLQYYDSKQEKV